MKTITDNWRIIINAASQEDAEHIVRQVLHHVDVRRTELTIEFDSICPWCRNVHGFEPDENGSPQCCNRAIEEWEAEQAVKVTP